MTWSADPKKNRAYARGETCKIRWETIAYTQGRGLDIGCGREKLWRTSIGIDAGQGAANLNGPADALLFADASMDYVYSSHCLEDLKDHKQALREWWRVLKVGGYLVLYLPHRDLYPNIGTAHANPAHQHDFVPEDIVQAMRAVASAWRLEENQTRGEGDEYSFLLVFRKLVAGTGQFSFIPGPLEQKRCTVIRYGGFGDALVAASTFPHLKTQGYHLTVITSDKGEEALRHDPHIDRLIAQDIKHLPYGELRECWNYLRGRCDKFVNFSETFEGMLLTNPVRPNFWWPHAMRQKYLDLPYLELAHDVAQVPQDYRQAFYPTETETLLASSWAAVRRPLAVVAASGSGVNKFWPGIFELAWRLAEAGVHVAVVADLRGGSFVAHERIHVIGETWPVREAYALAQSADLVIGPETGLLNAVAMEAVPKIVLLSHSSANNLTRFWANTHPLSGDVPCFPCHRLHHDWRGCRRDAQTDCAACQAAIKPQTVLAWALKLLAAKLEKAAA